MLLEAARTHEIDLSASWMIGDSEVDVQAGRSAGCRTARVLTNAASATQTPDITGSSLLEVVEKLLALNPTAAGLNSKEALCQEVA